MILSVMTRSGIYVKKVLMILALHLFKKKKKKMKDGKITPKQAKKKKKKKKINQNHIIFIFDWNKKGKNWTKWPKKCIIQYLQSIKLFY